MSYLLSACLDKIFMLLSYGLRLANLLWYWCMPSLQSEPKLVKACYSLSHFVICQMFKTKSEFGLMVAAVYLHQPVMSAVCGTHDCKLFSIYSYLHLPSQLIFATHCTHGVRTVLLKCPQIIFIKSEYGALCICLLMEHHLKTSTNIFITTSMIYQSIELGC